MEWARARTAAMLHRGAFALALAAGFASASAAAEPRGFVAAQGTQFVLDGKPFRVAGVNNHYLAYGSQAEVVRVLDDAVAMNANVVRTFITPIIGSLDGRVATIWDRKSRADSSNLGVHGVHMASWDAEKSAMIINDGPNGLGRMDFVLQQAAKRNLKLIIAFADFWAFTGGAQQMGQWYGGGDKHSFFATEPRLRADFKRFVTAIVTRKNRFTGVAYRDDPTIFAWNLLNEPDIRPNELFLDWVGDMAAHVKSLDPNHMVSSGHDSIRTRLIELELPHVDFGTWHGYPAYRKATPEAFGGLIDEHCALAERFGKPVILEEFGIAENDVARNRPTSYRDWLERIRSNRNCAGWLVWRLVSLQDSNAYPFDFDRFDIHNDGSPVWSVLKDGAAALRSDAASAEAGPPAALNR